MILIVGIDGDLIERYHIEEGRHGVAQLVVGVIREEAFGVVSIERRDPFPIAPAVHTHVKQATRLQYQPHTFEHSR